MGPQRAPTTWMVLIRDRYTGCGSRETVESSREAGPRSGHTARFRPHCLVGNASKQPTTSSAACPLHAAARVLGTCQSAIGLVTRRASHLTFITPKRTKRSIRGPPDLDLLEGMVHVDGGHSFLTSTSNRPLDLSTPA